MIKHLKEQDLGYFQHWWRAMKISGDEAKAEGFNPDGKQLYIDPEECIDCGACEPECPVEAIYEESEVPGEWNEYIKKNYDYFDREFSG